MPRFKKDKTSREWGSRPTIPRRGERPHLTKYGYRQTPAQKLRDTGQPGFWGGGGKIADGTPALGVGEPGKEGNN